MEIIPEQQSELNNISAALEKHVDNQEIGVLAEEARLLIQSKASSNNYGNIGQIKTSRSS